MPEKIFTDGLLFQLPNPQAPDFVKGKLSIKVEDFTKFMKTHANNGWVNIDLKVSQGGKSYAELNTWKKANTENPNANNDDTGSIPF